MIQDSTYVTESELRQTLQDALTRQAEADTEVWIARDRLMRFLNPKACRSSVACVLRNGCRKCGGPA